MAGEQTLLFVRDLGPEIPEGACVNWKDCHNYPPGHPDTRNVMCDDCLDAARHAGNGRGE